ncbi:unnamed protein product [Calypogeia fissa]
MPVWLILVVAGVLVVAALVLIIAVHILDVHAEQQCAHLEELTRRSLRQNQEQARYQYRCGESQPCCLCGSVRNRRLQVSGEKNSQPRAKGNPKLLTASGLLHPLMDAACRKSALSPSSLECLSVLTSSRRGMASGFQRGWFNGRRFFGGNGATQESEGKTGVENSPDSVSVAASSAASGWSGGSFSSSSSTAVGGSDSDSMTTITATITASDPSSSSLSSSSGSQSSRASMGNEGQCGKQVPQRRLVLEILMSPSTTEYGQGGALPRATGVRLKLETNANLESFANLAAAASSGLENAVHSQRADVEAIASALTSGPTSSVSGGPISTYEVTSEIVSNVTGTNCASDGATCSNIQICDIQASLARITTDVPNNCECGTADISPVMSVSSIGPKMNILSAGNDNVTIHSGSSSGKAISSLPLDNRTGGSGSLTTISSNPLAPVSCKTRTNGQTVCVNSSAKAKAKQGTCSATANSSVLSTQSNCPSPSVAPLKTGQSHISFGLPLDGLGSLRISVLDGLAKGKSMKDCSKGVTAEIASALAALSVESIGGKAIGMGLTNSPGGTSSEAPSRACSSEKADLVLEEDVPGEGSGSEQVAEEVDERRPVPEPAEEDEGDGNKKEKRKKKNRGRRQKAKAAAVAAAAAGLEGHERHVNKKNGVEAVETMPFSAESEIGCICGTPKGAGHSSSCPYPFTSSGSMVQRKIKEQYDELVRSNVARTLTLAQVGRFTTCLVEAKTALQQKSDTIQRRFTIAKSLLSKADKSSFDRLCGQIYGLEIEQKKLEEDTVVYNRLQEQLKLSPAYQKMLEYGRTHFELQPNTGQLIEKIDSQDVEISFEELLAQEKKDSFWQKHGPSRSSMQVN